MRIGGIIFLIIGFTGLTVSIAPSAGTYWWQHTFRVRAEAAWVETKLNELNTEERIGQLFMIRAHSDKGAAHEQEVERLIKQYHVGGLIFFQGTASKQAALTNRYQQLRPKELPLMVAIDGEWGLGMRISNAIDYPHQLMLGAIQDNRLIYTMGQEVARQCRRIGVHINFAPVVDINNNPNNPVINDRSFGENRQNVAAKSYMYMMGMQDAGVMACAKHFPGHGDTDVDSHFDLPVIPHGGSRLDSIELFPFKVLAEHGIASVMIAHLSVPHLDNTPYQPSSLSYKIVKQLLIDSLGYKGLIFTDGLEMHGVTKYYQNGEAEVAALKAGNDILLLPDNVDAAFKAIQAALDKGDISQTEIDEKVRKVLHYKYRIGLYDYQPIDMQNIENDLNDDWAQYVKRSLTENALTAVRNADAVLPLARGSNQRIATVSIGAGEPTLFQKQAATYSTTTDYNAPHAVSQSEQSRLLAALQAKDIVLVSFHNLSNSAKKRHNIDPSAVAFIEALQQQTKVVVVIFGTPYSLKFFDNMRNVVMAYDNDPVTQELTAKAVFGGVIMQGKLPVTASAQSRFGDGERVGDNSKLSKSSPSAVGMDETFLTTNLDRLAQEAIAEGVTPGLQILIAKDQRIVYHKAFGHHTYDRQAALQTADIMDIASVTKVCATTLAAMKLVDEGKLDLDQPLGRYLPRVRGTNKENLLVRDVLAHHAGLQPWIAFYKSTVYGSSNPQWNPAIYQSMPSDTFSVEVADKMFMRRDYVETIWKTILQSELLPKGSYRYSDLGFYLMKEAIEAIVQKPLDYYLSETFYQPMGLQTITFNPLKRFEKSRIVPTEHDTYFRNQVLQGHVHDMGAAMLGGISGHAGLFSNAEDVAAIFQMLLNGGAYNGREYLKPATIQLFTTRYRQSSRRGLGFDMQELNPQNLRSMSPLASPQTFGHTGFTGIGVWADPKHQLIYIFFSNRTYPTMNNRKIVTKDIRNRIQTTIYQSIRAYR